MFMSLNFVTWKKKFLWCFGRFFIIVVAQMLMLVVWFFLWWRFFSLLNRTRKIQKWKKKFTTVLFECKQWIKSCMSASTCERIEVKKKTRYKCICHRQKQHRRYCFWDVFMFHIPCVARAYSKLWEIPKSKDLEVKLPFSFNRTFSSHTFLITHFYYFGCLFVFFWLFVVLHKQIARGKKNL